MDIGVHEIDRWHKQRGWSGIGYHWVIKRDGTIEDGRPVNKVGAHVKGYNTGSLGLCMVGGVNNDGDADNNFTVRQWHSLELMARGIKAMIPHITIHGHNEYANKACPSFSVQTWVQSKGI